MAEQLAVNQFVDSSILLLPYMINTPMEMAMYSFIFSHSYGYGPIVPLTIGPFFWCHVMMLSIVALATITVMYLFARDEALKRYECHKNQKDKSPS